MNLRLSIPVYADHHREEGEKARFRVRPLFMPSWTRDETDVREDRALQRLASAITKNLAEEKTSPDHRELLPWTFSPPATGQNIRLRIELRRQSFEGNFYVAVFEGAGCRQAVLPRGGGLSFECTPGTHLEDELKRVLTEHLRKLEKENEADFDPKEWLSGSQPHLTHVSVVLPGRQALPAAPSRKLSLGDDTPMDGGKELRKVGRCLDALYPNDLHHALLRENEVGELLSWFTQRKATTPMVLLVGRSKAGKTALIHECVRRRMEKAESTKRGLFWHVSPQRVISGMSYIGQWEQRWTAMLAEMRQERHILVLDDLPGLFEAGKTAGSDLSLGQVLKARQEHEPVAILAESTPEAWGRLRETDRAFASMFQVIHVREMDDDSTLRILIRSLQMLETRSRLKLAPEILPLIMRLQTRFGRARAFPGKGVEMLTALAGSFADQFPDEGTLKLETVGAGQVLDWFASRHGIRLTMIDNSQSMTPSGLQEFFSSRIMGQTAAVSAMTETVLMARAEVNDARRPLGSLLFLGPTGVGKTECAKALAEFVFGSEEKMLRFDLNEYSGGDAALRLIGSPGHSGLLTSRVRRQPFSLLLFDEVEKAHPDVFDLLLQVLGEGRLTDAQGQTVDFCNCLIILTSNIGAQKTRHRLGFDDRAAEEKEVYREAAEKFFRPEFFNRLDRIVPFHELRRQDIQHLAGTLSSRALARQGLRDRRVEVLLDADSTGFLAQRGYDPEYGARALRRAIETHLVEPLAAHLMTWKTSRAVRVQTTLQNGALHFTCEVHRQVAQTLRLPVRLSHDELLDRVDEAHQGLDQVNARLDDWKLNDSEDGISALRAWYYRLRDESNALRQQLHQTEASLEAMEKARKKASASRGTKPFIETLDDYLCVMPEAGIENLLHDLLGSDMSARQVAARLDLAQPMARSTAMALRLLWRVNRLLMLTADEGPSPQAWTLVSSAKLSLPGWRKDAFVDALNPDGTHLILEGHGLQKLAAAFTGVHASFEESLVLTSYSCQELPSGTGEISHIRQGRRLLDLRTGLCMETDDSLPLEMALALACTEPLSF
ncbi:ATP-dependent Clp protease ATP-binding subunit ClpA [Prosthecobacter fusiformis]|uniref:ATP-dependent Clp protease ATP-binding subunit ClpA n=1 Tax=Prosthecobacter fusiformis TaxID=48464 RepID=A0A4R7RY26_9BACT|nr:AAA family ATPase [Prosthecobacter fusiformis]TDU70834.1 ATP-dependent Clp protease ATP-binding subunit ClpA [Prosthecobacter fusiformis]